MPTCFLFGALFSVLLFQYQGGVSLLIVLKTLFLFETGVSCFQVLGMNSSEFVGTLAPTFAKHFETIGKCLGKIHV